MARAVWSRDFHERYSHEHYLIPLNLNIMPGPYKFNLRATVHDHGNPTHIGSLYYFCQLLWKTFYCNDNRITESDASSTRYSSTVYIYSSMNCSWNIFTTSSCGLGAPQLPWYRHIRLSYGGGGGGGGFITYFREISQSQAPEAVRTPKIIPYVRETFLILGTQISPDSENIPYSRENFIIPGTRSGPDS